MDSSEIMATRTRLVAQRTSTYQAEDSREQIRRVAERMQKKIGKPSTESSSQIPGGRSITGRRPPGVQWGVGDKTDQKVAGQSS